MSDNPSSPLAGVGVLVTRPRAQADKLVSAIEQLGGVAIRFPVIEIVPGDHDAIMADAAALPDPDIVLFVSSNAVDFGIGYAGSAKKGAIGPTTVAAIESTGQSVEIRSDLGYDSESLLAEPELQDVAGKQVRIIRGEDGRELLADTLRDRGATVNYLSVYERRSPAIEPEQLANIEALWRRGAIQVITVMSVQSLDNLIALLPDWCEQQIESLPLVTPAARVIKETLDRYPGASPVLAAGPLAADMVDAISAIYETKPE
jgi:uroporphyrinogen-III synthase